VRRRLRLRLRPWIQRLDEWGYDGLWISRSLVGRTDARDPFLCQLAVGRCQQYIDVTLLVTSLVCLVFIGVIGRANNYD